MATPFIQPDDDSEMPTITMMENAVSLAAFGHAMADYMMSDDAVFTAFCAFADVTGDDVEGMRGTLPAVHDAFQTMGDQVARELYIMQLMGLLNPIGDNSQSAS